MMYRVIEYGELLTSYAYNMEMKAYHIFVAWLIMYTSTILENFIRLKNNTLIAHV